MTTPTPDPPHPDSAYPDPSARPRFTGRRVDLVAGTELVYHRDDWVGALVIVAAGEIELVRAAGDGFRFRTGSMLVLDLPDLRVVRNSGPDTARLVAIFREPPPAADRRAESAPATDNASSGGGATGRAARGGRA